MIETILTGVEVTMIVSAISSLYLYAHLTGVYKLLYFYVCLMAILNALSHWAGAMGYNLFLMPISGLVTLFLFSRMYLQHFIQEKLRGFRVVMGLVQVGILCYFLYSSGQTQTTHFNALTVVFSYGAVVVLCFQYYIQIFQQRIEFDQGDFIFNAVVLVYFASSALFFITTNFLINEALHLVAPFWVAYGITTLLFYLYLTYKIWQHGLRQSH